MRSLGTFEILVVAVGLEKVSELDKGELLIEGVGSCGG